VTIWAKRETKTSFDYQVGTMIELPRACLMAGEIARRQRNSSPSAPTT
jgi:phosphoenolpyruvate synthase/pyruvate phosphate dikinase